VEIAKDSDIARLLSLAKSNLQDEDGEADEEEGHDVGDEECSATIILGQGREAPHVSESNGGSDGGEIKGRAAWPSVATFRLFGRLGAESGRPLGNHRFFSGHAESEV
jgi:hypothetical protein